MALELHGLRLQLWFVAVVLKQAANKEWRSVVGFSLQQWYFDCRDASKWRLHVWAWRLFHAAHVVQALIETCNARCDTENLIWRTPSSMIYIATLARGALAGGTRCRQSSQALAAGLRGFFRIKPQDGV